MGVSGKPRWFRRLPVTSEGAFGPVTEEIEWDGFDHKRRRPFPDAYTKSYLDPDPVPVVPGRAEYELWRAALDLLVDDLSGTLESREPLASPRPRQPWETPPASPRVLPSLLVSPAGHGERR